MSVLKAYWKAVGKLRPEQVMHLRTVEWLLDSTSAGPVRRSGRTTVMALAFLRDACAHPGRHVPLFDHSITGRKNEAHIIQDSLGGVLSDVPGAALGVQLQVVQNRPSIRVRDGWTHVLPDPVQGPIHTLRHEVGCRPVLEGEAGVESVVQDIVEAVRAAMRLGASADAIISAVRDTVVGTVMEE